MQTLIIYMYLKSIISIHANVNYLYVFKRLKNTFTILLKNNEYHHYSAAL